MFKDATYRLISLHDTWMSVDPIVGCPFSCRYCVLRHSGGTGTSPVVMHSPEQCVAELLVHPLYVPGVTRLALGNETDMLHFSNRDYFLKLLFALQQARIENPIALITKARLDEVVLQQIRSFRDLRIFFCLSYSGLAPRLEPNFTDESLRGNFRIVKQFGFPILHFWRPLLPENSTNAAIERMLTFVPEFATVSVFVGLKLHPALTKIVTQDGAIDVPLAQRESVGEWLDEETIDRVYSVAARVCPAYPLYRHTSCGVARIMSAPNHTGTVYRKDICDRSHCPVEQRSICGDARRIPAREEIERAVARLGRPIEFSLTENNLAVETTLKQEEYAYLVQLLSYPVVAKSVEMQNLYFGNINKGRWTPRLSERQ